MPALSVNESAASNIPRNSSLPEHLRICFFEAWFTRYFCKLLEFNNLAKAATIVGSG